MGTATGEFTEPDGSIIAGDCIAAMATMAEASVDLVFPDPPHD
jgi:DNA modification methylase